MEKMLSAKEIAATIGISENKAREMMRSMPHFVAPGGTARKTLRVWESDFMQFLRKNTVDNTQPHKVRKKAPTPHFIAVEGLDERGRIRRRTA